MNAVIEALRKQAEAIKGKSDLLAAAEYHEKIAAALRATLAPQQKVSFKEIARNKRARADKYASCIGQIRAEKAQKQKDKEIESMLTGAGWTPSKLGDITNWVKDKQTLRISGDGDFFEVYKGTQLVQKSPLSKLRDYLSQPITQGKGSL